MIIVTKLNRNGGQPIGLDGTEWLYSPGAPGTRRVPKGALQRGKQVCRSIAPIRLKNLVWAIFFVQGKGENVIDRKDGYQRFG